MSRTGRTLAIEGGWASGFAVGRGGVAEISGEWPIGPRRGERVAILHVRLRGYLEEIARAFPGIDLALATAPRRRAHGAIDYPAEAVAVFEAWANERGLQASTVPVADVRRWVTGCGNAGRRELVQLGRERFQMTSETRDPEILARWLLAWSAEEWPPRAPIGSLGYADGLF